MDQLSIRKIRGIGPKRAELLEDHGIFTADSLLMYLPRSYQDYSAAACVDMLTPDAFTAAHVSIQDEPKLAYFHGIALVSCRGTDETGTVKLKWFNQPYRLKQLHAGQTWYVCGRVSDKNGVCFINPMLSQRLPGILPVYPAMGKLNQKTLRTMLRNVLNAVSDTIEESLSEDVLTKYRLQPLREAYENVHFPSSLEALRQGRRRIDFQRALTYLLALEVKRQDAMKKNGAVFAVEGIASRYSSLLPFSLTGAQKKAISEIESDLRRPIPMNRLLQGDVGSGKTAVAAYAMFAASENQYQSVLMAPTELLARQHFDKLSKLFQSRVCLLTGGMSKREKEDALRRIANEAALMIVGTHALFEQGVHFARLGMIVTDEQHRFGVTQRAELFGKGARPNVLVMSATPIPRTLALAMFADLSISEINEYPPQRQIVKTSYLPERRREELYSYIQARAEAGFGTYFVCPLINEGEEDSGTAAVTKFEELSGRFGKRRVGLLHGNMKAAEKQRVMSAFRCGEIQILVSTTVIEVGVDVPDATTMVIESAERFGLAQLHQLRGRVGRGKEQSYCFLMSSQAGETALKRFRALVTISDGFEIAEEDLKQRGFGDFIGIRQHGDSVWADLFDNIQSDTVAAARQVAQETIDKPNVVNNALIRQAEEIFQHAMENISMN